MTAIDGKHEASRADAYQRGVEAARNNVPKYKNPYNYSYESKNHNAWDQGHDDEVNGARPDAEIRPNMPEARDPADVVATKAAQLLDDDQVDVLAFSESSREFEIRGVRLAWSESVDLRVMHEGAGAKSLGYSYVSPVFRDVFFEAARGWHRRRRGDRCAKEAERIATPPAKPRAPEPQSEPAPKRKRGWWR